ncbi:MAG: protein translocase subunit SecE [Candidatus Micrarchaeota archaeon]|nr:MAG: protein translocase subunit SecE [Candidatus Micrarchaeota archaeon]
MQSSNEVKQKVVGQDLFRKLRGKLSEYRRVMHITYKPNREELMSNFKIVLIIILAMGVIGTIIAAIISLIVAGNLNFIVG